MYKVEITDAGSLERKTLTFKINELSRKVMDQWPKVDIKLMYYWDSHGRLIPWENNQGKKSETIKGAKVKVEEVVKAIGSNDITYEEWQVFVNDKKVDALDCNGYRGDPKAQCIIFKMIVGQG